MSDGAPFTIPPKAKYRAQKPVGGNKAKSNDSGPSRKRVAGPKTYNPLDHMLVVGPNGKARMVHREAQ